MYPETSITRRRRPRRTLDHLFGGDEEELIPPVTRPRTSPARTDEFAPYEGTRPAGSFAGDAAAPVVRALPPVRPPLPLPQPEIVTAPPETLESLGAPPVRPQRDFMAEDAQTLRELHTKPVERSRLKSFGAGLGRGGIIGGLFGLARPEMYGEMKRNREIKRVEDRIGSDLEIRKAQRAIRMEPMQEQLLQSQIDENKAQAEARSRPPRPILGREVMEDGTTVQTEFNPETGVFEPSLRNERPIVLSRPKTDAELIEMTLSDGRTVKVPAPTALTADATRTGRIERKEIKEAERESQRLAAQDEFEQLTADEITAGDEKNRAYAYLESLKANPNVSEDDIREATRAAEAANSLYRSFGPKKSAAKAKITRYSSRPDRPTAEDPLKGAKWYKSRYKGSRPIEEAAAEARARGAIVLD